MGYRNDIQGKGVIRNDVTTNVSNLIEQLIVQTNLRYEFNVIQTFVNTSAVVTPDTRRLVLFVFNGLVGYLYPIAQFSPAQTYNVTVQFGAEKTLLPEKESDGGPIGEIVVSLGSVGLDVPGVGSFVQLELLNGDPGDSVGSALVQSTTYLI